jgi:predicted Fe-S protein YdhL (DUF1289 family)
MSIETMKQALEALETLNSGDSYKTHNAATALRQAIEQAEKQEQKTPLKVLGLTVFTENRLRNGRVYDVEALQAMTNRDILAIPDMGKKALKEVLEALDVYASDMSQEPVDETPPCKTHPDAPHGFDRNASHSADRYVCECEGWERLEPIRTRIMSEAYDLADRGDSEGYNSVKVMCSDVLALIETDVDKACTKVGTKSGVLRTEWVGLTDEERSKIWGELPQTSNEERDACIFAQAIEAKLKEKNVSQS